MRGANLGSLGIWESFRETVNTKINELFEEIYQRIPDRLYHIRSIVENDVTDDYKISKRAKKFKLKVIYEYIKLLDGFLREKGNEIYDTHFAEEQLGYSYNEYLVNNFTIKEIILINPDEEMK